VPAAQWLATLPMIAVAIAASFCETRVRGRIDAEPFRVWVKRALLVIAIALLAQTAYQQLACAI